VPERRSSARATSAGRAQAPAVDEAALRAAVGHAVVGLQPQEAVLRGLLGVRGDEGALALAAHQQVLGGQFVDRLAHRALADLEARRQLSSLGIASPGRHTPACRSRSISALICWYSGLKAAAGGFGQGGGGRGALQHNPRPPASSMIS
jgi:hypothetical protein